ncbi:TolC family protein [Dinghuibacter silviterrae]|uniref:Outer membrane protein n=1 Tax=Dinghuibacter silviterrae TaxID=1539049 RepID=A0A4R8DSG7_9BACT|nr:TolC family protein [Dinghuibacter silviterrae]TDX01202.1 outer membrane protein [Dinghuibacter silviterrae]
MIKRIVLWGGLVLAGARAGAQVTALSLQDCIDIGVTRSTPVLLGNNAVALSAAQVLEAYGQLFLPDLTAGAGYNYSVGNNFYGTVGPELVRANRSAFNYQLTSSINIFSGYSNLSAWKAAKLNKQSAELSLEWAKEQIAQDITQSYLQVILDRKFVDLDSDNLRISEKREDQLTALTTVGQRAKTDLYQQQAQTSRDQLTLINARNQLRTDKILLLKKLRLDSLDRYAFPDLTVDDAPRTEVYGNEEALVQKALSDRVDQESLRINTEAADWEIKRYKGGYLPKVSFGAGVYDAGAYFNSLYINHTAASTAGQEPVYNQLYKQINGVFGVSATWNIFDKYYTKSNVEAARIQSSNARIDLEDNRVAIVSEVRQAYGDYTAALQQVSTAQKGLVAAQEAFDNLTGRYQQGVSDFIDLSNAQLVLLQAKQTAVQASLSIMLQKRVIDFYTGHELK